ncbi:hypothetical protein ACWDKQ_22435 [Saccharopolyspora sp. NPDC000995]
MTRSGLRWRMPAATSAERMSSAALAAAELSAWSSGKASGIHLASTAIATALPP